MSEENDLPPPEPEKKLTSEKLEPLREALDVLYIKGNMGGRITFNKDWPEIASHILSDELIKFDTEGTQDLERRAALEEEAVQRRIDFLELIDTFEEKSVQKGALQPEYVDDLIKTLGRDIALYLYAPRFVDRIFPPPAVEVEEEVAPEPEVVEEKPEDAPIPILNTEQDPQS